MFILSDQNSNKPVGSSAIEGRKIHIFDEHISPHEVVFGNRILDIVSAYATQVSHHHSDINCRTAGIDFVRFFAPAKRGDVLICKASVNRSWGNTMEVGVKVIAEDFRSLEQKHILSAYFTYEACDSDNKPLAVPVAVWETKEQERRFVDAEKRRNLRIKRSQKD